MKHFVLLPNTVKDETVLLAAKIEKYIVQSGGTAVILQDDGEERSHLREKIPPETEAVLTLGGDGTLLRAVHDLYGLDLLYLGVNLGTLGFLAEADQETITDEIDQLFTGHYTIENRLMLRGQIFRGGQLLYEDISLNDIVVQCADRTRASRFLFSVNGETVNKYFADGISLATPTGSTAYNLSCGGPISLPGADVILMTPVNPHTLMNRSMILTGDTAAEIEADGKDTDTAAVFFDSHVYDGFRKGDRLIVRRAEKDMKLIRLGRHSFQELLKSKLE